MTVITTFCVQVLQTVVAGNAVVVHPHRHRVAGLSSRSASSAAFVMSCPVEESMSNDIASSLATSAVR